MTKRALPTRFLPAERATASVVRRQHHAIAALPMVARLLDVIPDMVWILNPQRQIIHANRPALATLELGLDAILGKRHGEALGCIHADEPGGCGTTEFCTTCGAGVAMACALKGVPAVKECRIATRPPRENYDLRVWAAPFRRGGLRFTVFSIQDISHEKRRRALERIFFHDVLNTVGVVQMTSELIASVEPLEVPQYARTLARASRHLAEDILAERDLSSAESGELRVHPSGFPVRALLDDVAGIFREHAVAAGKTLSIDPALPGEPIATDRTLLGRVMGNMIKNALEAEPKGAAVAVGCGRGADGSYGFWVRNPSVMPRDVRLQMFQRSFSTKGEDRGLGTYSIKLLVERYLGGVVSFSSEEGRGTEFRATLPALLPRVPDACR